MHLQLCSITRQVGHQTVLQAVDLDLPPGSIHTILGGRGAGKTALLEIIAGKTAPDEGTMHLDGKPFAPASPAEALAAGVALIGEEPVLAPDHTVEENLLLGREPAYHGLLLREERRELARAALKPVRGDDIPLDAPASLLTFAQQRRVELARALLFSPKILLLDTPREGRLHPVDAELFREIILSFVNAGGSVLLASHTVEEPRIGRYTILLDGIITATGDLADLEPAAALRAMGGAAPESPTPYRTTHHIGPVVLEMSQVAGRKTPQQVSLTLRKGEIFGLAGLPGSGREATLRILFGLAPMVKGTITFHDRPIHHLRSHQRFQAGIGYVSNKHAHHHPPNLNPTETLLFTHLSRMRLPGWFSWEQLKTMAQEWTRGFHQHGLSPEMMLRNLSTGNRRMLALGRLFQDGSQILLLGDPTSGVSPSARRRIHEWIGEVAGQGKSVLLTSPSIPELLALCDTIGVMRHGVLVEVRPAREWTEAEIVHMALGAERTHPPELL